MRLLGSQLASKLFCLVDLDEDAGRKVVRWLANPQVDLLKTDTDDHATTVRQMHDGFGG